MLCLSEMPTMAEGRLCRAVPRRDGTGEIAWDVDISFNMMDEGEAETANHYVPGALQAWQAGQESRCQREKRGERTKCIPGSTRCLVRFLIVQRWPIF